MENTINNKSLKKGYNDLTEGKRNNRLAMILVTVFSCVITLTCLVLYLFSNIMIADKVKVIDRSGNVLNSELMRREQMIESGLKSHVKKAIYYLNSGTRYNLKTNQAKALFLVNTNSAYAIYERWKKQGAYADILQRGHQYEIVEEEIFLNAITNEEPFFISVEAILKIKDGSREAFWKIKGKGEVYYTTPSYPNNDWGFDIQNYTQEYTKVNLSEND